MAMMIRVFPSSRKKVKREKNKGTLVVGADNAMGISMTITEQVYLSSSNLSDLAQCLTVNQKSRILRIFAAFCGILRHFAAFCGISMKLTSLAMLKNETFSVFFKHCVLVAYGYLSAAEPPSPMSNLTSWMKEFHCVCFD